MKNYGLKDKVVLVTGANNPQGIGAATALAFACEGAKVVFIGPCTAKKAEARRKERSKKALCRRSPRLLSVCF